MSTNTWIALVRREWLQHRFAWAVMAVLPAILAILIITMGQLHIGERDPNVPLATALTMGALGGSMGLYLVMMVITSLIIVTGIARRDHADRSIEFWLSLPAGHLPSLLAPLLVHLVLVPIAALVVGTLAGVFVSAALVGRIESLGAWVAQPWPAIAVATASLVGRLAVGLVMGMLWLAPLLMATVLLTAWFRRWGIVILAVGIGLGSQVLRRLFGQPVVSDVLETIGLNAGLSVAGASKVALNFGPGDGGDPGQALTQALAFAPRWALADAGAAVQLMASPVFVGGLLVAAACTAGLVMWRRAGAGS